MECISDIYETSKVKLSLKEDDWLEDIKDSYEKRDHVILGKTPFRLFGKFGFQIKIFDTGNDWYWWMYSEKAFLFKYELDIQYLNKKIIITFRKPGSVLTLTEFWEN